MALIFPEDRTSYPGKITFRPIIEKNIVDNKFEELVSQSEVANQQSITSFNGQNSEQLTQNKGVSVSYGDICSLYLPAAIQFSDAVVYTNTELGTGGAAAEASVNQGLSAGQGISSFIEGFKTPADASLGKLAVGGLVEKFGAAEISSGIKSANRVTSNPNARALFESVTLREFTFSFKLIPDSRQEAQNIKDIIQFFRSELYPEDILFPFENIFLSLGYKFPNKFKIQMSYNGQPVATKIKPAYLKSLSTNYNSTSMGIHKDGNFSEVDLTMTFMEAKALSKADIVGDPEKNIEGGF